MNNNSSNSSGGSGNTRLPPKKKQISPSKHWRFTFNNYTETDIKELISNSSNSSIIYVFQEEIAPSTGTPHLQGHMSFPDKVRPKNLFSTKLSWRKSTKVKQSIAYASDPKKRKPGGRIWNQGIKIKKPIKILDATKLYNWQKKIIDVIIAEPNDRTIYWYWETIGCVGKSTFCKYLVVKHEALILSGKGSDMKYGIVKYVEKHGDYPEIIILDIPRSCEGYISWAGIEEIKNACFFSPKYEADMVVGNCPHLICFANFKPDTSKISEDRWDITEIGGSSTSELDAK